MIYPPIEDLMGLPKHPGVYAMWEGTTCIYVGSSNNVFYRVSSHPHLGKFDAITFRRVPEVELLKWELQWVEELKPTLNKARPCRTPKRFRYAWRWVFKRQGWSRISVAEIKKWSRKGCCIVIEKFNADLHWSSEKSSARLRLSTYRRKKRSTRTEAA